MADKKRSLDKNCITAKKLKRLYCGMNNTKCRNDYISYLRRIGMPPREIVKDFNLNIRSVYKIIERNKNGQKNRATGN